MGLISSTRFFILYLHLCFLPHNSLLWSACISFYCSSSAPPFLLSLPRCPFHLSRPEGEECTGKMPHVILFVLHFTFLISFHILSFHHGQFLFVRSPPKKPRGEKCRMFLLWQSWSLLCYGRSPEGRGTQGHKEKKEHGGGLDAFILYILQQST